MRILPILFAALESLLMTSSSVLKLTLAFATTRSPWLCIGERRRVIEAGTRARRMHSMFSMRESPNESTPACTNAPAISQTPLTVTSNCGAGKPGGTICR